MYTWGNGVEGQLGIGTLSNHHSPQLVNFIHPQTNSPLETFCVDLDCGSYHTGAITGKKIKHSIVHIIENILNNFEYFNFHMI